MKVDVLIVMELEVGDGGVIKKNGGTMEVTADCQYSFKRIWLI